MTIAFIVLGILTLLLIVMWIIYNGLVAAKNTVDEAFSGIDIQLKKRFELIPNLIEAVKGYNQHEAATLEKIVSERSATGNSIQEMEQNDRSITGALRSFRIQVEAYPDLKANSQFLILMKNLSDVENELAMARRYLNGTTRDYNTKIQVFPASLVAGSFGFHALPFYKIEDGQDQAPIINLND